MLTLRLGAPPPAGGRSPRFVAAIGNFDGLHVGHRYLLQQVVRAAQQCQLQSLAITFWPHPRSVLQPERWPGYLTTFEEREALLKDIGLDALLTLPFTREFASLSPQEFVAQLMSTVPLAELWVGEDFRFGRQRAGDAALLRELGAVHGFSLRTVTRQTLADSNVSSSTIREQVRAGEVAAAAHSLGRPYRLGGSVVPGDRRGRLLGFPTANLAPDAGKILPGHGIYAAIARSGDLVRAAAVSIGVRPQFGGGAELVEAYLLDFAGDLYGRRLDLDFLAKLREEQRFDSVEALVEQMGRDVARAREVVGEHA